MKRSSSLAFYLTVCIPWIAGRPAAAAPAAQPVYIYLSTTVSDHINPDISEERLRRALPMLERYRKHDPAAGVSATILFSGAMSQALEQRNSQTHILDFVRDFIQRGLVQPGYDGADEPTYENRPVLDLINTKTPEERWLLRLAAADKFLTEARNPLTGQPVPGKSGGLKKMQEVFGPAASIRGIMFYLRNLTGPVADIWCDTEIVHQIRQYNTAAVMLGIADTDPSHAGPSNYRGWAAHFSSSMSPAADTSPELFWQEDMLRSSEASGMDMRLFRASDGVEKLKAALKGLDRSKVRIIHVEIASQRNYAKPQGPKEFPHLISLTLPLKYAYEHPDQPQFPAAMRYSAAEVDAAYANEDAVMNYLMSEFFPANAGSRFVSNTDLKQMTPPGFGYDLSMASLRPAVQEMVKAWGDDQVPPKFLRVQGHYLSQADMFQVMSDALANMNRTGKLPRSVRVARVYGPIRTMTSQAPVAGETTVAAVARACSGLADALHDDTWSPIPHNAIPSEIAIDGQHLNQAEFLRLMAEALVAPSAEATLKIKKTDLFWGREATFYRRRLASEMGFAWTYKPAAVKAGDNIQAQANVRKSAATN